MLTKQTVFVLGAGASQPYHYPTGIELSARMAALVSGNQLHNHMVEIGGFSPDEIGIFKDTFLRSGKSSVDAFLEHNPNYLPIGKAATACALIPLELEETLFSFQASNWLRYLYNGLNATFDEFGKNTLSIVTFNYDRSVEHFLHTSLKNTYGKNDDDCAKALQNIPIVHLHGQLGFLPWERADARPFGPQITKEGLQVSVAGIKVIHEDIDEGRDKEFTKAKELLQQAGQILFAG